MLFTPIELGLRAYARLPEFESNPSSLGVEYV